MSSPPIKLITSHEKLLQFQATNTYKNLIAFIVELQHSVWSKKISDTPRLPIFAIYDKYFTDIKHTLAETPPIEGKNRFGNLAFRDFFDKIVELNAQFLNKLLLELALPVEFITDLKPYLDDSYGDRSRVDYGTGHELNFMIFLFCINQTKPFHKEVLPQLVHQVFYDYIFTMRKIQLQYNLEPAGSHGVWGLDDYHFLPFIFGGAELVGSIEVKSPKEVRDVLLVEQFKHDYMYLNCIAFIRLVKKSVSFGESSPILNDISEAVSWEKVANGMIKMYQVEVFGKLPVVQHIRFGKFFEFK